MNRKRVGVAFLSCILFAATTHAADRFTRIVEEGGEATVTAGGFVVNQKRVAVIAHFEGQGLSYDPQRGNLKFAGPDGEFVDGLSQNDQHQIRIWRKPQ